MVFGHNIGFYKECFRIILVDTLYILEEDLPLFPVCPKYLKGCKERVNLARELDKLELQIRKATSEESWLQKAAKEMEIIVDETYPFLPIRLINFQTLNYQPNHQYFS